MKTKTILLCGLASSVIGCATVSQLRSPASDSNVMLHLISTTDVHGYITEQKTKAGLSYGGVDVMNGYFNNARKADPETIFLDSGDLFQGTIISNTSLGSTVVQWMNYAGYTATAIGNHDFDFGPGDGHTMVIQPGEDPLGALKAREAQAKFKFLSANICSVSEDPGKCQNAGAFQPASFASPYLLQTVHGLKVGVIGLTTTSTPATTMPSNVSALRFMPLKETLERYVPEVKARGADVIVVIMHEGGFCDKGVCNPKDPVFRLIDQLSPEIRSQVPIILAGHTHNYTNTLYNGVHVLITGCYGQSFGYSTLVFHGADKSVSVESTQSVDFCSQVFPDTKSCYKGTGTPVAPRFLGDPVQRDPSAIALIQTDINTADAVAARVIGKLATPVDKGSGPEATIGDLMADSYRFCKDSSCENPADIAFENNGGIRTSSIPAGPVTYGQVFELEPFDNLHADLMLRGSQIHDLLDAWFAYGHSLNQVSGLTITYNPELTATRKITNSAGETETLVDPIVRIQMTDGQAFDENHVYHVVMADFLAVGGSGTAFVFKGLQPQIDYGRKQRDEIVDYLLAHPEGLDYSKGPKRIAISD